MKKHTIIVPALLVLISAGGSSGAEVPGTPTAPNTFWTPPPRPSASPATPMTIPPDLEKRLQSMVLADVIDVALSNNPATRAAWENAKAASEHLESEKGAFWPQASADVNAIKYKTTASQGRIATKQTVYTGTLNLSYLLLDFGGRSARIEMARQALYTADWTHNAVIQEVVLQVELAFFQYVATKATLIAEQSTLAEAAANLDSANRRHEAGVATIADVLLAKTALSQAQLLIDSLQGALQTTRGSLAVSMGLPAYVPVDFDLERIPKELPTNQAMDTVENLIQRALIERPDLAALQAQAQAATSHIREVKSSRWPTLNFNGNVGRTYFGGIDNHGDSYSAGLYVHVPLFTGFSQVHDEREAEAQAQAATEQVGVMERQVISQVFSSYYLLKTATQKITTSDDLLASATQSEAVAGDRYKVGVGTIIELLTAQTALAEARAQQIQARWEWYSTLAQLAHDTGVLDLHGESSLAPQTEPAEKESK